MLMIKKINKLGGIREMMLIAFPMIVSQSCETTMVFTDRLFLSKLGSVYMTAAMMGGLTVFVLMTFFIGLTGYTNAMVAQYFGSKQYGKCSQVTAQSLVISVVGFPILLLAKPLIYLLFNSTGISEEQLVLQNSYFSIISYGIIFGLIRNSFSGFFSGIGKTKVIMIGAIISMSANIIINYVLIFGKFGFPKLGIQGAAYGTIIAGFLGALYLFLMYISKKYNGIYHTTKSFVFNKIITKKLLKFGTPAGVELFVDVSAFQALIIIFHSHSQVTATASTIMMNWDMVAFVPLIGIQIAVTSLVGRYIGAKQIEVSEKSVYSGLKIGLVYAFIIAVLFIFFSENLVDIFRPTNVDSLFIQARSHAIFMVRFVAVYVSVDVIFIVFTGALRGAGDTFWSMIITSILHISLIPTLYFLIYKFNYAPRYAWVGVIFVFMVFSIIILLRFKRGKWKTISVIDNDKLTKKN